MKIKTLLLAPALGLLALPLLAWEPATGPSALKRAGELSVALSDKSTAEQTAEKAKRARQAGEPSWVKKGAWKIEEDGHTYYYGVGMVSGVSMPSLRTAAAEAKARAQIASLLGIVRLQRRVTDAGETEVEITTQGEVHAQIVDWYDNGEGSFYALAVEMR
jgi:hypothetical protein